MTSCQLTRLGKPVSVYGFPLPAKVRHFEFLVLSINYSQSSHPVSSHPTNSSGSTWGERGPPKVFASTKGSLSVRSNNDQKPKTGPRALGGEYTFFGVGTNGANTGQDVCLCRAMIRQDLQTTLDVRETPRQQHRQLWLITNQIPALWKRCTATARRRLVRSLRSGIVAAVMTSQALQTRRRQGKEDIPVERSDACVYIL